MSIELAATVTTRNGSENCGCELLLIGQDKREITTTTTVSWQIANKTREMGAVQEVQNLFFMEEDDSSESADEVCIGSTSACWLSTLFVCTVYCFDVRFFRCPPDLHMSLWTHRQKML